MIIVNGFIAAVEPTDEQYERVVDMLKNYPQAPEGYVYMLNVQTLEWELVELPPEPTDPDIDDAEALAILLGGGEV